MFLFINTQLKKIMDIVKLEHSLKSKKLPKLDSFFLSYFFCIFAKKHLNMMQNTIKTAIIVAVSENNIIGKEQNLPWRLSDDLKNFKEKTLHHAIIMGRKTFQTFPKPLPKRQHIIISRNNSAGFGEIENSQFTNSLGNAISLAKEYAQNNAQNEVFVIGGGEIYKQSLENNLIDVIYLTRVHTYTQGDTFFPEINLEKYTEISKISFLKNEKNEFDFDIIVLEKIKE